ncbi:MAG: hypothetical protein KAT65_17135, partial [Methanophagales archaeon]|nr:hypothetical protein [Methanophagales archaeon]
ARSMPPKLLAETLARLANRKIRRYCIRIAPVELSDKRFLELTDHQNHDELPPFFFDPTDREKIVKIVKKEYPTAIEQTIKDADAINNHIFDLLGSGKVKLGEEIDWHLDFKTGFRWNPKGYYLWTRKHVDCYLKKGIYADVKIPWELSRCQHIVTLGKGYWYTGDEKYTKEFNSQIVSWIAHNPVELGVNWACTMDVAIRAVNWIWGYYFFCGSPSLTKEFKLKLFKSLYLHGRHIVNNLEFGRIRGNHYLSDIAGLVYLGILFHETKEGQKWLEKGLSALKEELKIQVYEDGVDCEGSISYHRLVTELFLSTTLICIKNGITFPQWYMTRLEKMIEFVMYYTKPDGTAPQLGDNDDGRLHILSNYGNWNRLDHRYLLSVGAVMFKRKDFKEKACELYEESFWLLGEEGLNSFDNHKITQHFFFLQKENLC